VTLNRKPKQRKRKPYLGALGLVRDSVEHTRGPLLGLVRDSFRQGTLCMTPRSIPRGDILISRPKNSALTLVKRVRTVAPDKGVLVAGHMRSHDFPRRRRLSSLPSCQPRPSTTCTVNTTSSTCRFSRDW